MQALRHVAWDVRAEGLCPSGLAALTPEYFGQDEAGAQRGGQRAADLVRQPAELLLALFQAADDMVDQHR